MQNALAHIRKMRVSVNEQHEAQYWLSTEQHEIYMNKLIGNQIELNFAGQINCIHCGRKTNKSFNQGYCFPCFRSLAQCDTCIIKPEQCHFAAGTCREPDWGQSNCMQDHFVYLANTGAIKVGITRHVSAGVSSRWIDQGATQALPIYRVQNRKISGLVEIAIARYISDKTNWRTMLKGDYPPVDLVQFWRELRPRIKEDISLVQEEYGIQAVHELDAQALEIDYPVREYPKKIKSLNLLKNPIITGKLLGIKGQYLMLDEDRVINIRNASGCNVCLSVY